MLPNKIKLLEKEYDIKTQETNLQENELGGILEHYDLISISEYQSYSNQCKTLLHELVHALFQQTGHTEYDKDEDLIDCVALGIYSLVKNNYLEFINEKI